MDDEDKTKQELIAELRELRLEVEAGRRAEKTLRAKQEQWLLFSLATNDMLWNWDFSDNSTERSIRFETAFGYASDEVTPEIDWWIERLHPDCKDRVMSTFSEACDSGASRCSYDYQFRRRDGSYADISDNVFLIRDAETNEVVRALGAMSEVSERRRLEAALRASQQRFQLWSVKSGGEAGKASRPGQQHESRQILNEADHALRLSTAIVENMADGVVLTRKRDGIIALTNPRFDEMFGYGSGELAGQPISIINTSDSPDARANVVQMLTALEEVGSWRGEVENVTREGESLWCHATVSTLENSIFGTVFVAVYSDISEQKKVARRRELLTRELDHRVKNNLATIIGLASQTANRSDSLEGFVKTFVDRLHALACMHEALAEGGWTGLGLDEIVERTMSPFASAARPIHAEGPPFRMASSQAPAFGQALHELATNAAKYGALSTAEGRVDISWSTDESGAVVLQWKERGGPPVSASPSSGLGLRLVKGLIESEIGGRATFSFPADGVQHEIQIPGRAQ